MPLFSLFLVASRSSHQAWPLCRPITPSLSLLPRHLSLLTSSCGNTTTTNAQSRPPRSMDIQRSFLDSLPPRHPLAFANTNTLSLCSPSGRRSPTSTCHPSGSPSLFFFVFHPPLSSPSAQPAPVFSFVYRREQLSQQVAGATKTEETSGNATGLGGRAPPRATRMPRGRRLPATRDPNRSSETRDAARYEQGQPGVVGCSCVWNFAGNSDGLIDGQTGSRRSIPSFHLMWLTLSRSDQTG